MDNRLLKILEKEVKYEKSNKKKKNISNIKKEKRLMYYSGWHKDDKHVTAEEKGERQMKLK